MNSTNNEQDLVNELFNYILKTCYETKGFEEYKHIIDAFMKTSLENNPELTKYLYKCIQENLKEFLKKVELPVKMENNFQRKHEKIIVSKEGSYSANK